MTRTMTMYKPLTQEQVHQLHEAMNLIMQGYATLEHSCKNCNPFHIDTNKDDYNKPFKYDDEWYEKKHDNCYED